MLTFKLKCNTSFITLGVLRMDQTTKRKDLFLLGLVFAGTTILFFYYFIFPFIIVNYDRILTNFLVEKYEIFAYLLSLFTLITFVYAWIKIKTRSRQGMLVLMLPFLLYISIGRIIKLTYSPPTHLFETHIWFLDRAGTEASPYNNNKAVLYVDWDASRAHKHLYYVVLEKPNKLPKTLVYTFFKYDRKPGCDSKLNWAADHPETLPKYIEWIAPDRIKICGYRMHIDDPQKLL